ncbi:BgTH12-02815 [Blumeria graminis f. sp. triticale]|uniref:Bgt-5397 n=3 Tax=Blumeria graminis TaxID=34373 RepID=A0A381LEL2_BLUGR|nr:hypothetical protein BGT96224_5397 [Blumeria graminis f. sp. tritici 96224]CAD6503146.1 BgTH12-02815 [Blumeria graminis f. sp. triticale]VDB89095.1 Bgt-5397 [Blumeria graminis f. sp. tritici]
MADLMWTPEIEADIARWKLTGIFPFLNLCACPLSIPARFSYGDLRLFYHVASISSELDRYNSSHFTLWTWKVPLFLRIAVVYPYVMHALLALAATHLAWLTKCTQTANMAYRHRGAAMKSLQKALSVFCPKNSDAVLAASLLLSWQESNWCGWTQLMHGTSSIIIAMQLWKNESEFGDFIAEQSIFPTVPLSSISCTNIERVQWRDLDALERACVQLQKVEIYLETKDVVLQHSIRQLIEFIKKVRNFAPSRTTPQRFEMLDPLRIWLFWRPVAILQTSRDSPPALLTLAHLYAMAILIEPLFPEVGAAYFGSLSIGPVERIEQMLFYGIQNSSKDLDSEVLSLMRYPIDMVASFRRRMLSRPEVTPLPFIYDYNPITFERLSTWVTPY